MSSTSWYKPEITKNTSHLIGLETVATPSGKQTALICGYLSTSLPIASRAVRPAVHLFLFICNGYSGEILRKLTDVMNVT
jgi:hypothetical protein